MPRVKLTLAYDGTDFSGWQKQHPPTTTLVKTAKLMAGEPDLPQRPPTETPDAGSPPGEPAAAAHLTLRTVQEVLERAVQRVVREPITLLGASRTDAGVHARGQVAAFTCSDAAWPAERGLDRLVRALNGKLPEDVLVRSAEAVHERFDPITHCTSKGYTYTYHVSRERALFDRRFVYHAHPPLDAGLMNAAAAELVGEHDFAAFAAAGHGRQTTVRRVLECRVATDPDSRLTLHIAGTGFLWNMVRIIAGTLLEAGRGKLGPEQVRRALAMGDRRLAGPTLPASGLCLEWIRYDAPAANDPPPCASSTSPPV